MSTAQNPKCAIPTCDRRTPSPKHEFCEPCADARRSFQLKINNEKWKARKAEGQAGHKVMYRGEPTKWALDNSVEAVRMAVKEGYDNEVLERLIKAAAVKLLIR
jgi:hypothetical protein